MYKFRVENEKILYLLGFVMGLSLVFIVLEWSRSESFVQKQASIPVINDVEEILPVVTIQSPPPPPPPLPKRYWKQCLRQAANPPSLWNA